MQTQCVDFVTMYTQWLKENMKMTVLNTSMGQFTQIATPFLDRHNDHMQIFVKDTENGYLLTDGGYIINDLEMCGCDVMSSPKRRDLLKMMLNSTGAQLQDEQITISASKNDFPQKKHSLIQAMLSVNDMFMLSRPQVSSLFIEDVKTFFDLHEIRYTQSPSFYGTSGFLHTFEFVVPKSKSMPDRFIKAINDVSRDKIDSLLFSWEDTKSNRPDRAQLFTFLNNEDKEVKPEYISALSAYGVSPILWTEREKSVLSLVA